MHYYSIYNEGTVMENQFDYYLDLVQENVGISRESLLEELKNIGASLDTKERESYQIGYLQGIFEGWFFSQQKNLPN